VSGGVVGGVTVNAGGVEIVFSGGQANSTILSGGTGLVVSGGTLSGATLDGGFLLIQSGGTAGTSLITISSGMLALDDSLHFSGTVAGLLTSGVQNVDLKDITYNAATTSVTGYTSNGSNGGTVSVTDGVHTTLLKVIGAYTSASFKLSNDGGGGTLITDPPVSSGVAGAPPH
jgi:autotransporter passenger strand-loop-strand repeat protein